jgi:hypothetical protein
VGEQSCRWRCSFFTLAAVSIRLIQAKSRTRKVDELGVGGRCHCVIVVDLFSPLANFHDHRATFSNKLCGISQGEKGGKNQCCRFVFRSLGDKERIDTSLTPGPTAFTAILAVSLRSRASWNIIHNPVLASHHKTCAGADTAIWGKPILPENMDRCKQECQK